MAYKLQPTTNQEAFDVAARRILDGKGRAMSPDEDGCVYYSEKTGLRCAVGAMLTEEDAKSLQSYLQDWCSTGIERIVEDGAVDVGDVNIFLLRELQKAHDMSATEDYRRLDLKEIAFKWGLDDSVLNEIGEQNGNTTDTQD